MVENVEVTALPITAEPMWSFVWGHDLAPAVAAGVLVVAGVVLAVALVIAFAAGCAAVVAFVAAGPTRTGTFTKVSMVALRTAVVAFVPFLVYEVTTGVVMGVRLVVLVVAPVVVWAGVLVILRRRVQGRARDVEPSSEPVGAGVRRVGGADARGSRGQRRSGVGRRGQRSRVQQRVPAAEG